MSIFLICIFAATTGVFSQTTQSKSETTQKPNPRIVQEKMMYEVMKIWLLGAAEKMLGKEYGFKPTEAVRTYGQILGHLADQHYLRCSLVLGEKDPNPKLEKNKISKEELTAGLKDAFSYCDKAYSAMTEKSADEMVKLGPQQFSEFGVLNVNLLHSTLHYGNLITYMRLKNIVPPSSEPPFGPPPKN